MKNILQFLRRRTAKTPFFVLLLIGSSVIAHAQYTISGKVIDDKGHPVNRASVYLDNTLDGGTTDTGGNFKFTTSEKGNQTVVASEVSHSNGGQPITISGDVNNILIKMKSMSHDLHAVTITAGSFDASNDKDKTVLKPLDIVTTAGTQADVVRAIETLPGTQHQGTENGLFVRGGDASESNVLVDGMIAQNAFFNSAPGVTTRSRFGAFQYKGVSFSSGGYSARYGQALSGILELNSLDLPEKSTVNLGVNMAGIYAQGTKLWKNSSLEGGVSYNNLTPFYGIATTNFKFYDVPVGGMANARYTWIPKKDGILKITAATSNISSGIAVPNPYAYDTSSNPIAQPYKALGDTANFHTNDQYYYTNISYRQLYKTKFLLYTGASYSYDNTDNRFGTIPIKEIDQRLQYRVEGTYFFTSRFNLMAGGDIQNFSIKKTYDIYSQSFTETQIAGFLEAQWSPINLISFKPGVRIEHSALLDQSAIAPRFSMAIKTGDNSQVSLASGIFYQDVDNTYLLAGYRPKFQQAIHYIANWQWSPEDRTLRIEGYYKNYQDLVRERSVIFDPNQYRYIAPFPAETIDNSGYGYAGGVELFWRDKKSVKNMDYWISYSYIDTRRLYKNYVSEVTPDFIAANNLNLIWKYFIDKIQTNISTTYSYSTGRPSYNNNFQSTMTPAYQNLSVTISYLHTFGNWFSVFYAGLDNITNYHNVFGYRYSSDGASKTPIVPALYRSIFVGANFSLTKFSKDEL